MTWTKIDDQFHAHPKVLHAWQAHRAAIGLNVLALSYAGAFLTDGHVPDTFIRTQLPAPAERRRAVGALIDSGLWERDGAGWLFIHDYHDFNESRQAVLERHASRARPQAPAGPRARVAAPERAPTPTPYPLTAS